MSKFFHPKLVASVCRESFYEFVKEFWYEVVPDKPVWNWHIEYLCNEYQTILERVFLGKPKAYDHLVNIPPGTSKSTIASIMQPAWAWTRFPGFRHIGASYSFDLQQDLSRKCRLLVQSERYAQCFPEVQIQPDQNTKAYFATTKGGFRYGVGSGGSVLGYHAHVITIDDPINPEQAASEAELKTINRWIRTTLNTRLVDKSVSVIELVMQRLGLDDPSDWFLKRRRVRHVCLPAEVSDLVSPVELKERYVNGLLDPVRLSKDVLLDQFEVLGQYGYASQFEQSPVPAGGGMFKTQMLGILTAMPFDDKIVRTIRFWDKAGTARGGAYTVGWKMGITRSGRYIVLDVVRGQWDSYNREQVIKRTAVFDGIGVEIGLEQEPGSGGKESMENTLRALAGYRVHVVKVDTSKVDRADTFSVQVNGGNVYLMKADWNESLIEEYKYFPNGRYKDQVDAGSGAFNILHKLRMRVGGIK